VSVVIVRGPFDCPPVQLQRVPIDNRSGHPERDDGVRAPAISLILISFLTFFLGLGRQAITDSDEAFYAEASREMVETGDWLTPRFNYADRWQKPVLYYWLGSGTYLVTGPTEFAARLWSALSGLGLVLLAWLAARRMTGDDKTGWLAGAITATSYGYFAMARLALPDLPLTFFITLGIWAGIERRWALAGAAAGFGFLMKGPVALVIPGLVLLPIWWRDGAFRALRIRDLAIAALLFAAIGLPWYTAMTVEHGTAYLESFFLSDNLERFATDRFNEPRPIWFYLPIVVGGMMPWAAYLLVLAGRPLRDLLARRRHLTKDEWRLVIWAAAPLLFYTLSIGKQPRYILPVLPPLAIGLAHAIMTAVATTPGRTSLRRATWTTAVLFVVLAVLLARARPLFITVHPTATWMFVAGIGAAAVALAWLATTAAWTRLPVAMTASATVLLLAVQFGALAGLRPEPVEEMAALVRTHRTAGEPVGGYEVFVRNLVFYTGVPQTELFDEASALDFITSSQRVLLVVRPGDLQRLETIARVQMRSLGQVRYLNTANIRLRTLLAPIPAQDLETVLLVTNQ
jgi:4-amino-4-deoxy-L-arabinose transferase-like glycosyltransferase